MFLETLTIFKKFYCVSYFIHSSYLEYLNIILFLFSDEITLDEILSPSNLPYWIAILFRTLYGLFQVKIDNITNKKLGE